jgi:signal transduction histidine kinase
MAPLINEPRKATIQARTAAKLLKIDSADFAEVLKHSSTAAIAILRTIAGRVREMEAELSLNQKMAALGTLSAGLAHELNNPSAALRRAADQLRDAFERWKALGAEMGSLTLTREEREIIDRLLATAGSRSQESQRFDPLARVDAEEEIERWLEGCSVERPWELAALLVDAGLDESDLTPLRSGVPSEHLSTILWWTATGGVIVGLLAELAASAGSISDIVAAVKSYTHLDQAPVQEIDVHAGIDQTLMILRHELRQVRVRREYAPDLPRITAWASELNQVWTNLITNAVDAMQGAGELTIRTHHEGNWVIVEIEDSGPGIPLEIQPRLFEPFFTTKGPGRGTGLGLHISYNIVTQKHHGTLRVTSQPGRTTFEVSLPTERPA